MRIVTLIENTTAREDLACEHGLSLYIETQTHKILFDAGQTAAFADNAQKLGVDLAEVDIAILSHGHYDHSGGLMRFLQLNSKAPVYVHKDIFLPRRSAEHKDIGVDPALLDRGRLILTEETVELATGITLQLCRNSPVYYPADSFGLQVQMNGAWTADDFHHEQYLVIEENGKKICFSGCSHRGILNIVKWLQPDVLFGGFHFVKLDPQTADAERLKSAAQTLLQYPATYYTGHCTGQPQFAYMQSIMQAQLQELSTGVQVQL